MRLTTTTFFFMCVSSAILGSTATNDLEKSGPVRHRRLAQKGVYAKMDEQNTVKYRFTANVTDVLKKIFEKATQEWETGTCLKFTEDKSDKEDDDAISLFYDPALCFTDKQKLYISDECYDVGAVAHELGHALGLGHAHNRQDRDKYLTINSTNIEWFYNYLADYYKKEKKEFNVTLKMFMEQYEKMNETTESNYSLPYDYGSIMHYAPDLTLPAMVPVDEHHLRTMGSQFISFLDRLTINRHYNCTDKCKDVASTTVCQHHGFPDPKNCSTCFCPSGYGGQFCDQKPGLCGNTLVASSLAQNLTISIKKLNAISDYSTCTYWIQSSGAKKINVRIASISDSMETTGCAEVGIEIKTKADERLTGYRFCAVENANVTLTAESSPVPIIAYSSNATANFRAVLFYWESETSQE